MALALQQHARNPLALEQVRQQLAATRPRELERPAGAPWSHAALAGRLVELSAEGGAAALTWAVRLVAQAQAGGAAGARPVAWVTTRAGAFYPPDAAANGVALEALAVVRVPDAAAVGRAAERLARSGGFGLIVLDAVAEGPRAALLPALQGRLAQHALHHGTAVLCLTEKPARAASLGSLVSLRAQAERWRAMSPREAGLPAEAEPGPFLCALRIVKDKRSGPGWTQREACHGPPGLR